MGLTLESTWQVQEAKNRFSELIDKALEDGPQVVTRHGRPVVKVVALAHEDGAGAAGKDDGFAAHLLSVMDIVKDSDIDGLEMPVRRSRKRPIVLGD